MIWLPGTRRQRRRPTRVAGDSGSHRDKLGRDLGGKRPPRSYGVLAMYISTLAAVGGILWATPRPKQGAVPVTAPAYAKQNGPGLGRWLASTRVSLASAEAWLRAGVPLYRLVVPQPVPASWSSWLAAGVTAAAGTRINSLQSLLGQEIPGLKGAPAPSRPPRPRSAKHHPRAATMAELPGAGHRIWAVLGRAPAIGIFQTRSTESFWPVLAAGRATATTTDWSKTVVAVGWTLARDLHQKGLMVVQSRVNNMTDGLLASDYHAYRTAEQLKRRYRTLKVLLDVNRATVNVPSVTINGQATARITLIVGTNTVLPDPTWRRDYAFAQILTADLRRIAPGILGRPAIMRVPYRYNEEVMPLDLVVQIGGPNNTLSQEMAAAGDLAAALKTVRDQGWLKTSPAQA